MGGEVDALGEVEAIEETEEVRGEGRVGLDNTDVKIVSKKEEGGKRAGNSEKFRECRKKRRGTVKSLLN